jgi:hypothetical protein
MLSSASSPPLEVDGSSTSTGKPDVAHTTNGWSHVTDSPVEVTHATVQLAVPSPLTWPERLELSMFPAPALAPPEIAVPSGHRHTELLVVLSHSVTTLKSPEPLPVNVFVLFVLVPVPLPDRLPVPLPVPVPPCVASGDPPSSVAHVPSPPEAPGHDTH